MIRSWVYLVLLLTFLAFLARPALSVVNTIWPASELTGGGAALDGIDGARLTDGDAGFVFRDNSGVFEFYPLYLENYVENPPVEASPDTISPDANANNKRWKLAKIFGAGAEIRGPVTFKDASGNTIIVFPAAAASVDSFFKIASDGTITFVPIADYTPIPYYGELTTEHFAVWYYDDGTWKLKAGDKPITDNTINGEIPVKACSGEPEVCTMEAAEAGDFPTLNQDTTGTASKLPVNAATDASGKESADPTTGQYRNHDGTRQNVFSPIQFISFVISAPAAADDINVMKAPYGMTILGIDCIVQGTTSATGQIQECDSAGANCADLDSDIACDADGAADDGDLTDSTIASGAWLRWKTTSLSGTPTFLTVTVRYRVVAD
jgi:hypothetical protein